MNPHATASRRRLLFTGGVFAAGMLTSVAPAFAAAPAANKEVGAAEDLMREHGVLRRVLLVYQETLRRIDAGEDVPPQPLADSAKLVRAFVEDYHEKLEEQHIFPLFRKANKLVDLVDVLQKQHDAGRKITDVTLQLATPQGLKNADDRKKLADTLRQFLRMYRPHASREDTILFPAFHAMIPEPEYDKLSDEFEKEEDKLFGEEGFEKSVDKIAGIEKALGIYELAQFTPG